MEKDKYSDMAWHLMKHKNLKDIVSTIADLYRKSDLYEQDNDRLRKYIELIGDE